jgi:ubiquinone/menaquinone biosynthesis C-methylase UbiE
LSSHIINPDSQEYIWNAVWLLDKYGASQERQRRAEARYKLFAITRELSLTPKLLDIGCGSGEFLRLVAERLPTGDYVGADRSQEALVLAGKRDRLREVSYICADALCLPFKAATFDIVTLFGLLEHVQQHDLLLKEVHRVLRPKGKVFISSSNANSVLQIKNRLLGLLGRYQYGYQRNWDIEGLRKEIEKDFLVTRAFVTQVDEDMPFIRLLDALASKWAANWGRYICLTAERRG